MGQKTVIAGIIAIVIAGILGLVFLVKSIGPKNSPSTATQVKTVVDKELIPVSDVVTDPYVYDGLTVKVESRINDWINKKSFTVSSGGNGGFLFGGNTGASLLIINNDIYKLPKDTKDGDVALGDKDTVQITGRVRVMTKEEVQKAIGLDFEDDQDNTSDDRIEFDNNSIYSWDKRVVILASKVTKPQIKK